MSSWQLNSSQVNTGEENRDHASLRLKQRPSSGTN